MRKLPYVSVIVPNYNHERFLKLRIETILNQTFQDFELILLDDYSTDKSQDILLEYSKHPNVSHVVMNKSNSGNTFYQWNKGLELAKGKFIWIAESDDFSDITFLEKLINIHLELPDISLAYCQSHKVDIANNNCGNWIDQTASFKDYRFLKDFDMKGNIFIEKYLIYKNVIPNVSAVLFKTEAIMKYYPLFYSPEMKFNADWFYYFQIIGNNRIAFLSESLNYFRQHSNSVIAKGRKKSEWKGYKMELETRKRLIDMLKKCNLHNFELIKQADIKVRKELNYLMAKSLLKERKLKSLLYLFRFPGFLWRVINNKEAQI